MKKFCFNKHLIPIFEEFKLSIDSIQSIDQYINPQHIDYVQYVGLSSFMLSRDTKKWINFSWKVSHLDTSQWPEDWGSELALCEDER